MNLPPTSLLADAGGHPGADQPWLLAGIVGLGLAVVLVWRWRVVQRETAPPTQPDPGFPAEPVSVAGLAPDIVAAIAAAVHETLGDGARMTSVTQQTEPAVAMETPTLIWSLEGRREIYTSHRVR